LVLKLSDLKTNKPKQEVRDLKLNEASMGVYKLKSEKYYLVPDKDRAASQNILQEITDTKNKVYQSQVLKTMSPLKMIIRCWI
jgi:hypothetical protein